MFSGTLWLFVIWTPKKKNSLSLHDRPAERAAELVALQPVVTAQAAVLRALEVANRVELVIADEIEDAAMELVRAGLGDGVHRRARGHAEARVANAGLGSNSCSASGNGIALPVLFCGSLL